MEFPADFFAEEERCGYTVPARMKEIWAVQLELMEQFRQVCEQHHLRWFVSGGTLLGAVRHGGYIPWDDDIDIQMFREDYERLLTIAPSAFAEPYFFQTAYTDTRYSRGHAQLRDSRTTAILPAEAGKYSFHQGIFIDIFPMDRVPDDPAALAAQRRQIRRWNRLLNLTVRYPSNPHKTPLKSLLHLLLRPLPYRWLYRRMETACRQYNGTTAQRVALLSFDADSDRLMWPAAPLETVTWVPFEHTQVPIPTGYDTLLTIQYGAYMTPQREHSYHGTLLFDPHRCYLDYGKG